MLWKTTTSTAFAAVLSGVTAVPLQARDDSSAGGIVLQPAVIPGSGFAGPRDVSLTSEDSFYWTHQEQGILANMTLSVADGRRILNAQRFSDVVESVDCSGADISIKFSSGASLASAQAEWAWVNDSPSNTVVYVVDGASCGGTDLRQPYLVSSIGFDASSASATLESATAASWRDFAQDATLRLHGGSAPAEGKRAAAVEDNVSIDMSHSFNGNMYSTSVGGFAISLDCVDCQTTGSLDADITLSLSHGLSAVLTARNTFGFRFAVGAKISGSLASPWTSEGFHVATVPLGSISIAGVADLGPEINLDVQASVSDLTGSVDASFGIAMAIPDGSTVALGQPVSLSPVFTPIGPSFSAQVSASAKFNPLATFSMAATFLGEGLVGGLALAAPVLTAKAGAAANSAGGVCPNSQGTSAVSFRLDVGVEIDGFAGFGSITDEPHKTVLYTTSRNLLDECLVITN